MKKNFVSRGLQPNKYVVSIYWNQSQRFSHSFLNRRYCWKLIIVQI